MTFYCNYDNNNSEKLLRLATKLAAKRPSKIEILFRLNAIYIRRDRLLGRQAEVCREHLKGQQM